MTRDLSGRGGGLDGDGGLFGGGGGALLLRGLAGITAEVRQRQGDSANVVDPQQDLQGADLLETLFSQGLTGPLDLLDAGRERAEPPSCRQQQSRC